MINKYDGTCIECAAKVAAGTGEARKSKAGRWYVLCSEHKRGEQGARDGVVNQAGNRYGGKWWGGRQVRTATRCEDAPCCGCCGPGSDDPAYAGGGW